MEFRLIIAGGRDFTDYPLLEKTCDYMLSNKVEQGYNIVIVCGKANGADTLGEKYGISRGYAVKEFKPDWDKHGKSAGYIRNKEMCMYTLASDSGACICFHDKISKGTQHMINLCKENGLQCLVRNY